MSPNEINAKSQHPNAESQRDNSLLCLNTVIFSFQCHEKYLAASLRHKSVKDQERAYRELGMAHKNLGNLQQALVRKWLHGPYAHFYHFMNSQEDYWKPIYFVKRFGHFP